MREKQGFRDNTEWMEAMYPGQLTFNKVETAKIIGISPRTVDRWERAGKLKFSPITGRISRADLIRQVSN